MSAAYGRLGHKIFIDPVTGCWLYQGYLDANGYGRINMRRGPGGKPFTHRLAYTLDKGPIPDDLVLDHLCRTPRCCNPDHLEPVTNSLNVRRGIGAHFRADDTRCMSGEHDLTLPGAITVIDNTSFSNKRLCTECKRRTDRAHAARTRARKKGLTT